MTGFVRNIMQRWGILEPQKSEIEKVAKKWEELFSRGEMDIAISPGVQNLVQDGTLPGDLKIASNIGGFTYLSVQTLQQLHSVYLKIPELQQATYDVSCLQSIMRDGMGRLVGPHDSKSFMYPDISGATEFMVTLKNKDSIQLELWLPEEL